MLCGEVLGTGLPCCPWRLREHPLVRDVQLLYAAREMTDPVAMAGGPRAPAVVVEALAHYERCIGAIRAHEQDCIEEQRKREELRRPKR